MSTVFAEKCQFCRHLQKVKKFQKLRLYIMHKAPEKMRVDFSRILWYNVKDNELLRRYFDEFTGIRRNVS